MQWWNDLVGWLDSDDGWRVLSGAVFPFLAILIAGIIAALIGRGSTKRLITHHDREQRISTVSAMIGAARRASSWNTLPNPEQQHADHLAHDADISMRLLPLPGSTMTADWAAHKIAEMKKDSVSFSFQAEQTLLELRDRLVAWQERPSRAKKLFKADLDLWAYESAQEDKGLVEKQQEWAKQQIVAETGPITTARPTAPPAPGTGAEPAATDPARSGFAMPAAAGSGQVTTPVDGVTIETPNPISAQTVRQRILPDSYKDDDPR